MKALLKPLLISSIITILTLTLCEIGLRIYGYVPGKVAYDNGFKQVEHLALRKGFVADSNGIFRVNPDANSWIDSVISQHRNDSQYIADHNIPDSLLYEIYSLGFESLNVLHGKLNNELTSFYQKIKNKNNSDEFNSAVLHYLEHPINSDGFRSIEFKKYNSTRKKILLIGDSFTWGHSATDITNSFADILLANEYIVYNTGISGADPAQYFAIAAQYIPLLKPDLVIVNFYLGNDVQYYNRKVLPYKPIFYSTNAGNLMACPYTDYFESLQEAYNFVLKTTYLEPRNFWNRVCSKTVITTLVWKAFEKLGCTWNTDEEEQYYLKREPQPTANRYMGEIDSICKRSGSKFILAIIPELKTFKLTEPKDYKSLFAGQSYFYPSEIKGSHYHRSDGHFNDEGGKVYGQFLKNIIEKN